MEIVYRDLSTIKPNPKNPRKPKPNAIVELAESIKNNPDYFEARPILLSTVPGNWLLLAANVEAKQPDIWKWKRYQQY